MRTLLKSISESQKVWGVPIYPQRKILRQGIIRQRALGKS
jgi:hypothetical protein